MLMYGRPLYHLPVYLRCARVRLTITSTTGLSPYGTLCSRIRKDCHTRPAQEGPADSSSTVTRSTPPFPRRIRISPPLQVHTLDPQGQALEQAHPTAVQQHSHQPTATFELPQHRRHFRSRQHDREPSRCPRPEDGARTGLPTRPRPARYASIVPQPELRPHEGQQLRIGLRGQMRSGPNSGRIKRSSAPRQSRHAAQPERRRSRRPEGAGYA
jgi:hypothetical protein